jgi:DNA-binding beta-propeller fold protein YncE
VITTTLINGCPVSGIAISQNGAYAYVVNQQVEKSSTIIVLNITNPYTTNSTLVATIPVGSYAQGIATSS